MEDEFVTLTCGEPAPWFTASSPSNPAYRFESVAGRWIVLAFLGSSKAAAAGPALKAFRAHRSLFDDKRCSLFCVSNMASDEDRVKERLPGWRWLFDPQRSVSALYGAAAREPGGRSTRFRPLVYLLDPQLRVYQCVPLREIRRLIATVAKLPSVDDHAGVSLHAPVLIVPRVFEPSFCDSLMDYYETGPHAPSGFMRDVDGKTTLVLDNSFKRRSDCTIADELMRGAALVRLRRRLFPEIAKAFQFQVTRIERYIVACYDAENRGFFKPHRDNTTAGTAHRRFAVSINLNDDFEGGELVFPEFGGRRYRPPRGGAVVFGCSLLHAVTPTTRGRRYAFLPFLYDEAAALQRQHNNDKLSEDLGSYVLKPMPEPSLHQHQPHQIV
ncbi:MAG: 2OG-Fe(II) oxygenase [Cypionkella sp.]